MSRIGKQPVPIPTGVKVEVKGGSVFVQGPKGKLERKLPEGISVSVEGGAAKVARASDQKRHRAFHGLARALLANMVKGVVEPFSKSLEIVGTGFNAMVTGKKLDLIVGYANTISLPIPDGIEVTLGKTKPPKITISGADKERVGQFAAAARAVRPPSPYSDNKGIRYEGEQVRKKVGKAFGSAAAK
ncbi:50S ribosomal protein L6 [bacterium]|nr:50S ribosomal protein L6 [bacterium]